ncbi:MAG: SpoIIE family protein phosphatase, partial [Anaerolineae bacterium]|nr:SpoIIE family protein phosphatase [Anaerolineae bacterium]
MISDQSNRLRDAPRAASTGDVLIVDDTPANLRLLAQMLAENGFQVRPVPDGALALAAVQMEPPDLILLDIRMPEMSGYEVCERLKADPKTADIPIIFISALDAVQDKVKAFAAGGVDYVTKPFRVEEVLARVETHLSLRQLQRRLQDANRRMERELMLAAEVQAGFMPRALPVLPGWDMSVVLRPARETSGDFYDIYHLPDGRVGIVVADVVDKGVGAALFMALSWSLLRTRAAEYPGQPDRVFDAVNHSIQHDTSVLQFVTVFYGILEPATGELLYCNAGHCPGYLFRAGNQQQAEELPPSGAALGLLDGMSWTRESVQLAAGDLLVLYTDGVTEAHNEREDLFDN